MPWSLAVLKEACLLWSSLQPQRLWNVFKSTFTVAEKMQFFRNVSTYSILYFSMKLWVTFVVLMTHPENDTLALTPESLLHMKPELMRSFPWPLIILWANNTLSITGQNTRIIYNIGGSRLEMPYVCMCSWFSCMRPPCSVYLAMEWNILILRLTFSQGCYCWAAGLIVDTQKYTHPSEQSLFSVGLLLSVTHRT